jgi:hypothetical protein
MAEMTCEKWGGALSPDYRFCVFCAHPVPDQATTAPPHAESQPTEATATPTPPVVAPPAPPAPARGTTASSSPKPPQLTRWWPRQERPTKAAILALSVVSVVLLVLAATFGALWGDETAGGKRVVPNALSTVSLSPGYEPNAPLNTLPTTGAQTTTGKQASQASQVGQSIQIGSTLGTVDDVQFTNTLVATRDYVDPKVLTSEQGTFVIVLLTVENQGMEPFYVMTNYLTLKDQRGRTFTPWDTAPQDYYLPVEYSEYLGDLNPGFFGKTAQIFEVPKDSSGFTLMVVDLAGDSFGSEAAPVYLGN